MLRQDRKNLFSSCRAYAIVEFECTRELGPSRFRQSSIADVHLAAQHETQRKLMLESENAFQSSAESEGRTEANAAAPTPSDIDREDLPSLHMLEESAAQLAALRQRAEFLLEQLSTGSVGAPSHSVADEGEPDPPQPAGGSGLRHARQHLRSSQTGAEGGGFVSGQQEEQTRFEEAPPPLSLENDFDAARASDANSEDKEAPDQHSGFSVQGPPAAQPDFTSPRPYGDSQLPRGAESPPWQDTEMPAAGEASSLQPEIDPPLQEEAPSPAYPIQRYHPQPSSILDSPIGASQPTLSGMDAPRPTPHLGAASATSKMQVVEEEIITLYKAIQRVMKTRRGNTGHALSLLREAREIVLEEPQRIERAEYNIQQARQILDRARLSRRQSRLVALRTIWRLILWLVILGGLGAALYFYPQRADEIVGIGAARVGWDTSLILSALWAVVAGGAGGCLGTISILVERMRVHQAFDDQYILRSTIQPLMGVVLGVTIFGLLAVVFNSLGTFITVHPVTTYLPAAIAFPIGLWQEYVYALIFRLTRLFTFQRRRRW